jgi:hypothetical protein
LQKAAVQAEPVTAAVLNFAATLRSTPLSIACKKIMTVGTWDAPFVIQNAVMLATRSTCSACHLVVLTAFEM